MPRRRQKGWIWWSAAQTVHRGDISVLAIVETIAATSLSLWVAIRYQTISHLVVGACVAPLLLLRTEQSVRLGLKWFREGHLGYKWIEYAGRFDLLASVHDYPNLSK